MGIERITKIEKVKTNRQGVTLWDIQVSGSDTFVYNDIVIHNSYVNRGVKPGIRHVKGYYRKDGAYVKSHSFYHPGQRANRYIDSSVEEEFKGRGFADSLDSSLRMSFKNVRRF